MQPRLIAVAGPLAGSTIGLSGFETSVGRDEGNDVVIADDLVSRRHCLIVRSGEEYSIRDLGSHNRTYVNGQPVTEHKLRNGDEIQAGRSIFAFLIDEQAEQADAPSRQAYFEDYGLSLDITRSLRLRMVDSDFLDGRRPAEGAAREGREARDLEVLLEVSRSLSRYPTFDSLRERLFDLILDAIPADAGAMLLDPHGPAESRDFTSVFIRQVSETSQPFRFSRTLVQQVFEKNEAILCHEVATDRQLSEIESLQVSNVRSLLAVPMPHRSRVAGIIYLGAGEPGAFTEGDLRLLAGISGIIAAPLEHLRRLEWWERESLQKEREAIDHNILGDSESIARVRTAINRVADTSATVLIVGETGVGKELVARAIHRASSRSDGPFVDVNCASLKHELVESDLFGSERGGFTGAVKRKGKLEIADGGTLFLDEVGELESRAQGALLRVLETGQFQRVGGTRTIEVDVRIIAATNADLARAIRDGRFREDLFHRLNVFRIRVPPLRERRADLPGLAAYCVRKAAGRHKRPVEGLTPEARNCILQHDWPGNIRQLENAMEYAVISSGSELIGVEDLPGELILGNPEDGISVPRLYDAVNEATGRILLEVLESTRGRVAEAARLLGVHPNNLHRLIARHKLKSELDRIRGKSDSV